MYLSLNLVFELFFGLLHKHDLLQFPYHLLDVPRAKTFINTYNSNDMVLEELVLKLMGESDFKGESPVDAFCGKWDAHLS